MNIVSIGDVFLEIIMMLGYLFWWVGVGVLVVVELLIGMFYLLMIVFGFFVGGLL